jgi:hypothetical protein
MLPHLTTNRPGTLSVYDGTGEMIFYSVVDDAITEMSAFYFHPEGLYSYHFQTNGGVKKGSFVHLEDG